MVTLRHRAQRDIAAGTVWDRQIGEGVDSGLCFLGETEHHLDLSIGALEAPQPPSAEGKPDRVGDAARADLEAVGGFGIHHQPQLLGSSHGRSPDLLEVVEATHPFLDLHRQFLEELGVLAVQRHRHHASVLAAAVAPHCRGRRPRG